MTRAHARSLKWNSASLRTFAWSRQCKCRMTLWIFECYLKVRHAVNEEAQSHTVRYADVIPSNCSISVKSVFMGATSYDQRRSFILAIAPADSQ